MKKYWMPLLILLHTLVISSSAAERFPLLFVTGSEGIHSYVFRLLPTGELVTTGQIIDNIDEEIGVSPDSRFVWFGWSLWQGEITPYGWVTATGRTLPFYNWAKYTPNAQMLIVSNGPICHTYPDGSVESTANVYNDRGVYYISPRGDIHIRPSNDVYDGLDPNGNSWVVERIDYNTFNLYTIQRVYDPPPGISGTLAVFTPEGDYVALNHSFDEVVVYPILSNGLLDTTRRQAIPSVISATVLAITPNGNYIYITRESRDDIAILSRIPNAGFEDTGMRVSLVNNPWRMVVSPDGRFLVVEYYGGVSYYYRHIKVYAIQYDGSLVEQSDFPFEETFGDSFDGLTFAYPLGPTKVESFQWQLYQ